MVQRVIYPNGEGGICVLICHKADGTLLDPERTLDQVAKKDVPTGVPYRFVDESEIPADRSQRDLWTADFSTPDGHGE